MSGPLPVSLSEIFREIDIDQFIGQSDYCSDIDDFIGQDRAKKALEMGFEMRSHGYNILITGMYRSGKHTVLRRLIHKYLTIYQPLKEIVLVHNYTDKDRPKVLCFKAGYALRFQEKFRDFLDHARRLIISQSQSSYFRKQRDDGLRALEKRERQILKDFSQRLQENQFKMINVDGDKHTESPALLPVYQDKAISFDELEALVEKSELPENVWQDLRIQHCKYIDEMREIFLEFEQATRKIDENMLCLQRELVEPELQKLFAGIKNEFSDKEVIQYLNCTLEDIWGRLSELRSSEDILNNEDHSYDMNILIDRTDQESRPVIFEKNPTWTNLFGLIEGKAEEASMMSMKPGSLLQAHGGFLIVKLEDLLREDDVWYHFKHVLESGELNIQSSPSPLVPGGSLRSESIKIDVKVILIGSDQLYNQVYLHDYQFQRLFKILAEFNDSMVFTPENVFAYLSFCQKIIKSENLKPLTKMGLSELVKYGVCLAKSKHRITCQFFFIADRLREAHYWAEKMGLDEIDHNSITKAEIMHNYFQSLPQESVWRDFHAGQLLLDLRGEAIGKINALVVVDRGSQVFGYPTLITAQVFSGKDHIISIERETGLSGEIHDKGVFILEGFLRGRFSRYTPFGLAASLCFEQSYEGIEGDSAILAEICVLISALAKVPLKQGIAITGSMNQMGLCQPVGSVSEKIEGFFQLCSQQGLTGNQGVIFPKSNLQNLFLSKDLYNMIEKKQFFLWTVETIEQALTLLTGLEIGVEDRRHRYPAQSLFGRVVHELKALGKS